MAATVELCDFDSHFDGTRYWLTCKRCGRLLVSQSPKAVSPCMAEEIACQAASRDARIKANKATCKNCFERPDGCWKNGEIGCMGCYTQLEQKAAYEGNCPIGKLDR